MEAILETQARVTTEGMPPTAPSGHVLVTKPSHWRSLSSLSERGRRVARRPGRVYLRNAGNRIPFGGKVYAISYYAIHCERHPEPDLVAFTP